MVATVIRNKSHRVFEEIDENGNGVITSDDFERIAERLIQSFGAQTSPAADTVRRTYTNCWQRLAEAGRPLSGRSDSKSGATHDRPGRSIRARVARR